MTSVENICEPTPGGVNTVNVRLSSYDLLEYSFQRVPNGQIYVFSATSLASSRKFALTAGTYKLTYRNPSFAAVGVYAASVVVKPYKVVNGACAVVNPLGRAETIGRAAQ